MAAFAVGRSAAKRRNLRAFYGLAGEEALQGVNEVAAGENSHELVLIDDQEATVTGLLHLGEGVREKHGVKILVDSCGGEQSLLE